jgi:carboxyl-terminal processing protease
MLLDGRFSSFVFRYYLQHKKQVDAFASAADYVKQFNMKDDMWQQFVRSVPTDSANLLAMSEKQKADLQQRLEAYLARFRWRNNGMYQVLNKDDNEVKTAIEKLKQ